MSDNVVILPTVRVERHDDVRVTLTEIFGGRVEPENIECFLRELHRRGFRIAPLDGGVAR